MMQQYNAIVVRWLDIIGVQVDFSDLSNIEQAINARRLYTIHTAKTLELSERLGVHLMGYVDREGNDINNQTACNLTGYDYLGSMMFLCKTDDRYNALPFTEEEYNRVYAYLTNGKEATI